MIYTAYTINEVDCYLNQPYLSLNMVGSIIMMLVYFTSMFFLFLLHTSYNSVVYYCLVRLEQKFLKDPLQIWWILAVPFLFYGVFVKLVLDCTFCSTSLVSCAPAEFKLTQPLAEIPSFRLGSYEKNHIARGSLLKVVTSGRPLQYN